MKRIFFISPVRDWKKLPTKEKEAIAGYVQKLEDAKVKVHWPMRDTKQDDDPIGVGICWDNRNAMINANEVHIWWTSSSEGSKFDLGMWFGMDLFDGPKLVLANRDAIEVTPGKSFGNAILYWTGHLKSDDPRLASS